MEELKDLIGVIITLRESGVDITEVIQRVEPMLNQLREKEGVLYGISMQEYHIFVAYLDNNNNFRGEFKIEWENNEG